MESVDRWALSASVGPPPRIAKGQSTPRRSEYCYKVRVHMISFLHEPLLKRYTVVNGQLGSLQLLQPLEADSREG